MRRRMANTSSDWLSDDSRTRDICRSDYSTENTCDADQARDEQDVEGHEDLVKQIISQQLVFDRLSLDVIRALLQERQLIRDKNHGDIMERITEISGHISGCENQRYSEHARERQDGLMKVKNRLEEDIRQEDVLLWQDTWRLRQELVGAVRKHKGSELRDELLFKGHDEDKEEHHTKDSGRVQST